MCFIIRLLIGVHRECETVLRTFCVVCSHSSRATRISNAVHGFLSSLTHTQSHNASERSDGDIAGDLHKLHALSPDWNLFIICMNITHSASVYRKSGECVHKCRLASAALQNATARHTQHTQHTAHDAHLQSHIKISHRIRDGMNNHHNCRFRMPTDKPYGVLQCGGSVYTFFAFAALLAISHIIYRIMLHTRIQLMELFSLYSLACIIAIAWAPTCTTHNYRNDSYTGGNVFMGLLSVLADNRTESSAPFSNYFPYNFQFSVALKFSWTILPQ